MEYIDWKISGVMKLKNCFGYRVTLVLSDGTKKVQQKSGYRNMKDAQQGRDLAVAQLHSNSYVTDNVVTVRDYYTEWLETVIKIRCKASTYFSYYYTLKNHIFPHIGGVKLTELNKAHILHLYRTVGTNYKSNAEQCRVILKTGLRYAKQNQLISINPAKDVLIPKDIYKAKPSHTLNVNIQRTLTEEQLSLLIDKSRGTKIYLFILFAGLMGLRKSEILGLKYSDINFQQKTIHIQRQLGRSFFNECQPKTKTKQEIELKSRSSNRILNIPDIVFEAILEERQRYEINRHRRIRQFQDLDYICCSTYGRPRGASFCYQPFKQLLIQNNLPNIRFHDLRHTYATLLLKQDLSVKAISSSLGHAKMIISVDVYGDNNKIVEDATADIQVFIDDVIPERNIGNNAAQFVNKNIMVAEKTVSFLMLSR